MELGLIRHRRKERAFGPSPNNGYTAGSPKRKFWQRKPKHGRGSDLEKNPDALPTHTTPSDVRTSYATDATAVGHEAPYNKYGHTNPGVIGSGAVHGGGHQTTTTTHIPHQGYNANTTGNF